MSENDAMSYLTEQNLLWQRLCADLESEVALAATAIDAARTNAGDCVNFSPDCPYNCYVVDPQPYLTMPCLACALALYDAAVDRA